MLYLSYVFPFSIYMEYFQRIEGNTRLIIDCFILQGEGMSYRGSVLIEISSEEYEHCENGVVEVKNLKHDALNLDLVVS